MRRPCLPPSASRGTSLEPRLTFIRSVNLVLCMPATDLTPLLVPQRLQTRISTNEHLGRTKHVPHRPFYAVGLHIDGLDLRCFSTAFVRAPAIPRFGGLNADSSQGRQFDETWFSPHDYVDAGSGSSAPADTIPQTQLFQVASVESFTYTRQTESQARSKLGPAQDEEKTKFGDEPTHQCIHGQNQSESAATGRLRLV